MMIFGHEPITLLLIVLIVAVAGFIRGLAGFGSGMLMAGPLALIFGPVMAVTIIVVLEACISLPLLKTAKADVNKGLVKRLLIGAVISAPLGLWLMVWLPEKLAGQIIAVLVTVAAIAILSGFQRKASSSDNKEILLGGASGFSCGLAGISGPPVVLYLLSGPHKPLEVRASLIYYFALIDFYVLIALLVVSDNGVQPLLIAALCLPIMWLGATIGTKQLSNTSPQQYKIWALSLIILGNIASLIGAYYS